jgi:YVTN family beta-propeller protein
MRMRVGAARRMSSWLESVVGWKAEKRQQGCRSPKRPPRRFVRDTKTVPQKVGATRALVIFAIWLGVAMTSAGQAFRESGSGQGKTPKPALLVLNKADSELAIVDPGTLKMVAKVKTGPIPHEVAASADGKIAVATNYGAHQDGTTLSVIDLASQREIHRVELKNLAGPHGEAFGDLIGPHGVEFFDGKAWFTAEGSKKIARYDPATNRVDWVHEIGENRTHMLMISRAGHTIYTSNVNSDSVTAVVASADKAKWFNTVIPVGKGPEGLDLAPDGLEVWAANSGDGTVSIIDATTKKVKETVNVRTKHSNRLKFTPNGNVVLISDLGSGELVVLDAATRKEVKRLKLGTSTEGILIVPDGSKAFVAVSGDNKVAVVDLKKLEVIETFETGDDPDGMAWAE